MTTNSTDAQEDAKHQIQNFIFQLPALDNLHPITLREVAKEPSDSFVLIFIKSWNIKGLEHQKEAKAAAL